MNFDQILEDQLAEAIKSKREIDLGRAGYVLVRQLDGKYFRDRKRGWRFSKLASKAFRFPIDLARHCAEKYVPGKLEIRDIITGRRVK